MSIAVQYSGDVTKIDMTTIQSPQVCEEISKECALNAFTNKISAIACFVATVALTYFAYIAAAALIKSLGILAAGVTVVAVATVFPITLGAALLPIATLGLGLLTWARGSDYNKQRFAADLRKAELISVKP